MPAHRTALTRRLLAGTAAVAGIAALWIPTAHAEPAIGTGTVSADDGRLHFEGHWDRHYAAGEAATVNSGSSITLRYTGEGVTGLFDLSDITAPPQLWVTVDGRPRTLVTVDRQEIELAPASCGPGAHTMRIDVKDTDQVTDRWLRPLQDAVVLRGFRLADHGFLLPRLPSGAPSMAFYGDSITEGIRALGDPLTVDGADATRTYANLTARAFGAELTQVGFGKQGVMREGVGNVPSAPESFGYDFAGSPAADRPAPDVIVLLEGSNDSQVTDEQFAPAYLDYLKEVRASAPHAYILAMEPLIGRHPAAIQSDIAALADPRIAYVSTDGWLDRKNPAEYTDTVHPTVAGHQIVAEHLVPIVHAVTGLRVQGSPVRAAADPAAVPAGRRVTVPVTVHIGALWAARERPHGDVVVTPPAGFTVRRGTTHYVVRADGTATVTVELTGTLPAGAPTATGQVVVTDANQTEAFPAPLTVTAAQ